MSAKIEKALNAQINAEMWSAYLYLSMAANFHEMGYEGFANWFEVQFKEEQDHAMILYNFMISRGARVMLSPIAEVPTEWNNPLEAFEATLKHEKVVTKMLHDLNTLAIEENDYALQNRLQWFIDEQIEEEDTAQKFINNLKMIKDNGFGLYMLDKELASRSYTQAAPLAGKE